MQVTAAQGGAGARDGMLLRVVVLTAAAATQNGAAGTAAAGSVPVTTTQTGSRVYGAVLQAPSSTLVPVAGCTQIDDAADGAHNLEYGTFKTSPPTGTPGATTVGDTGGVGVAAFEVLAAGTLTEDASAPAAVSTTSAQVLATAAFSPPPALLVALVSADGGAGQVTMTVTGGALAWTERAKQNPAGNGYVGVWTAFTARGSSAATVTAGRDSTRTVTAGGTTFSAYQATYAAIYGYTTAASAPAVTRVAASSPGVS